jgi:RecA-family ATPase
MGGTHPRNLALKSLDVHLLDVPSLRLDDAEDQVRLRGTLRRLAPRLLVLDPLVRLHCADENSSGEISTLLSFLRSIERELETAIVLVHHTRKDAGSLCAYDP